MRRVEVGAPKTLSRADRPRLPAYVRLQRDETRESWVLQGPERVLLLDETSKEILDLCNGERSVAAIVMMLCEAYDAPVAVIEQDVLAVLRLLADKRLLDWRASDETA
jgi:pyrroloquinoline quinone biosynthesis protein D